MQKNMNISSDPAERDVALKETIFDLMVNKGLKGMTMDTVASELGISKRTLYEKFQSKSQMMIEVLNQKRLQHHALYENYLEKSANVMEAAIKMFKHHEEFLSSLNSTFFQEMDTLFPEVRTTFRKNSDMQKEHALKCFRRGVEQGVYRADVNYEVFLAIQSIQSEALKRMEELFPPDMTLNEVSETMFLLMLRSIATTKGLELLEKYQEEMNVGLKKL